MPATNRRTLIALALALPGAWLLYRAWPRCEEPQEQRIRADFAAGRTVLVDGWMLAQSEADWLARCRK